MLIYTGKQLKGGIELTSVSDLYQLNPDPAKNLNPDPDPEDLESGSGSKLFLNTILKKLNYFIIIRFSHKKVNLKIECCKVTKKEKLCCNYLTFLTFFTASGSGETYKYTSES